MENEELRDRLYKIAASDADPGVRAQARARLAKMGSTSSPNVALKPDQWTDFEAPDLEGRRKAHTKHPERHDFGNAEDPVELQRAPSAGESNRAALANIERLGMTPEQDNAVLEGAARLVNGASGGLLDAGLDTAAELAGKPRAFREKREAFSTEHPVASTALGMGGGLLPNSVPARIGGAVEKGVNSAVSALSPKLQALIGPTLRRVAGGTMAGAAVGGSQGALEAEGGIGDRLKAGASGALAGAAVGGGMSLATAGADAAANALSDEDVALLDKYGLRPSMIPGVPVTRKGASMREAVSKPPLGTHTAGPRTRQAAGVKAAETIVPDLVAAKRANSAQIAEERAGNLTSGVSFRPVPYDPAMAEAETLMSEPGTLPAVKSSIGTVTDDLTRSAGPKVRVGNTMLPIRGATLPAGDLQKIAAMSHDLANPDAYGAADKPKLRLLGGKLHSQLPAEMLDQDARYSTATQNLEHARELLRLEHGDLENPQGGVPRATMTKAASLLGRGGEDTKAAALAEDLGVRQLREEGPPEVMRDSAGHPTQHAPDRPNYAAAIDLPALHVAQENLQLNPSAVFSGAGVKGMAHRLGGAGARRFLYPGLRAAGEVGGEVVGRGTPSLMSLIDVMRLRLKQDEDQKDETP